MTGDSAFFLGYIEGREWAVNWAGEDVLQRLAANAGTLEMEPPGMGPGRGHGAGGESLERLTALLVNRPVAKSELWSFWERALPDADPGLLQNMDFLSGFLAGTKCIAQEPW